MSDKKDIIFWDDINVHLGKKEKDSIERIREDAFKLFNNYIKFKNRPHFTSVYEAFKDMHGETVFLMGLLNIIFRMERLENE